MGEKSKYQIEVDEFRDHFKMFHTKQIVIYGIGRRTATLLPEVRDFNIIGLLDRDEENIGKIICGIPVISLQDAENRADIIIINSDSSNFEIIYKRIQGTKIPVYYGNGERAKIIKQRFGDRNNLYWDSNYERLREQIQKHEIISFDMFDTLVMRKVFLPQDVFGLVEARVTAQNGIPANFTAVRQQAVSKITEREATLEDIYDQICKDTGLTAEQAKQIMNWELEIEKNVCVPRDIVVKSFEYARKAGKEVYMISDMYLPPKFLSGLLEDCGIKGFPLSHIWVSCEKGADKKSGNLWRKFQCQIVKNRKALHIGDDRKGDVLEPQKYGIHSFYIMSGKDMLYHSSVTDILPHAVTLRDSVHLGLLLSKMFNNPFALSDSKGKANIMDCYTFGYCVYGGIFQKFLSWLFQQTQKNGEERLLFFARDGYFLIKDFEFIKEMFYQSENPKTMFVPISRRLIYIATIKNKKDFMRVVSFPYVGTFKDYMKSRFNIDVTDETSEFNKEWINAAGDAEKITKWMTPYETAIKKEIVIERTRYIDYLKRNCIWDEKAKDAIVDLGYYGTNQFYFQELVGKKVNGYYFYGCFLNENTYRKTCVMEACFNDVKDPEGKQSCVRRKSAFLESFLTAPYGMIRLIDENGCIQCEPDKKNQMYFSKKEETNRGIQEYLEDYFNVYGIQDSGDVGIVENYIYYELLSGNCNIADEVLSGFYFDNDMVGGREMKLEIS